MRPELWQVLEQGDYGGKKYKFCCEKRVRGEKAEEDGESERKRSLN